MEMEKIDDIEKMEREKERKIKKGKKNSRDYRTNERMAIGNEWTRIWTCKYLLKQSFSCFCAVPIPVTIISKVIILFR